MTLETGGALDPSADPTPAKSAARKGPTLTDAQMTALGSRLTELASAAKINPAELARRAGLTDGAVRHYLAGRTAPALGTLVVLAGALGVTPSQLLEGWPKAGKSKGGKATKKSKTGGE